MIAAAKTAASTPINWWYVGVVAGTAVVSAAIGGLLGVVGANRTNRANMTQLEARLRHEREMAYQERQQDRRGQAYVEVLKYLHKLAWQYVQQRWNFVTYGDPLGPPTADIDGYAAKKMAGVAQKDDRPEPEPTPTREDRDTALALVGAFGSHAVERAVVEVVNEKTRAVVVAHNELNVANRVEAQGQTSTESPADIHKRVMTAYEDLFAAMDHVRELVRQELQELV